MPGTVIPDLGQSTWANQLMALFPNGWVGDQGKAPGGVFNATMQGCAANLEAINQDIVYGFLASRIATAVGPGLDLVSQDFYGNALPRSPGEPDASFRNRIQAQLLQPQITRQAIANILFRLTGVEPRMMEPWYLPDCCAWDSISYWDIDTLANPFRWASPELRYQGFIETALPPYAGGQTQPIYAFDEGWAYDTGFGCWLDPGANWYIQEEQVDNAITAAHAFGTIIWRKFVGSPPMIVAGTLAVASGATSISFATTQNEPYIVLVQTAWNTTAYISAQSLTGFTVTFSTPPGANSTIDYLLMPITTQQGMGFQYLGGAVLSFNLLTETPTDYQAILTPNWNTQPYQTGTTSDEIELAFGSATPALSTQSNAGFAYMLFTPGQTAGNVSVTNGSTSWTINLPIPQPTTPFAAFVLPSWNTQCAVTKTSSSIQVAFSTPAPSSASLGWAIYPL